MSKTSVESLFTHDEHKSVLSRPSTSGKGASHGDVSRTYNFDRVFGPEESTAAVYQECVRPLVEVRAPPNPVRVFCRPVCSAFWVAHRPAG